MSLTAEDGDERLQQVKSRRKEMIQKQERDYITRFTPSFLFMDQYHEKIPLIGNHNINIRMGLE